MQHARIAMRLVTSKRRLFFEHGNSQRGIAQFQFSSARLVQGSVRTNKLRNASEKQALTSPTMPPPTIVTSNLPFAVEALDSSVDSCRRVACWQTHCAGRLNVRFSAVLARIGTAEGKGNSERGNVSFTLCWLALGLKMQRSKTVKARKLCRHFLRNGKYTHCCNDTTESTCSRQDMCWS